MYKIVLVGSCECGVEVSRTIAQSRHDIHCIEQFIRDMEWRSAPTSDVKATFTCPVCSTKNPNHAMYSVAKCEAPLCTNQVVRELRTGERGRSFTRHLKSKGWAFFGPSHPGASPKDEFIGLLCPECVAKVMEGTIDMSELLDLDLFVEE